MEAVKPANLLWLRRDLRLHDNPALQAALAAGGGIVALYLHNPEDLGDWAPGGASRWYLHHSLLSLQQDLAAIGIPLLCETGPAARVVPACCRRDGIGRVFCNRVVEPAWSELDVQVRDALRAMDRDLEILHDDSLLPPEQVCKKDGTPFKVFTPFWRHLQTLLESRGPAAAAAPRPGRGAAPLPADPARVEQLGLLDAHPWHEKLQAHWQPGEAAALQGFEDFLQHRLAKYDERRDLPAETGTSRLSPALHFGEISVVRIHDACRGLLTHEPDADARASMQRFLAEVGWREFARHVLWAFPESADRSLDRRFENPGAWRSDPKGELRRRWQRGETGVALVDAGMRELWETGWMHNRVRMVVGSFLTKNLGLHWIEGARWFWDTLVDADLPSNTLGWQWVAGCGTDAAPYYRIFNPDLQAGKFDARGDYLRRWLGDGMRPAPMVDLKLSRARALERYDDAIKSAT